MTFVIFIFSSRLLKAQVGMGLQSSLTLLLKHCFCQGGKFGHFEHLLYKHNLHRKVIMFLFVLLNSTCLLNLNIQAGLET